MEREARQTRERASNASKARAEREARTARAGATRQGTEARREWREPPEDRNSKPVRSPTPLLGRFAAYAGGLRWESVSVTSFLCRPCVKPMKQKRRPEAPKSQPGASWALPSLPGARFGSPGAHFWPPGAHCGPPGALLGLSRRSREPLGSLLGPPKSHPEALPEASRAGARF